MANTKAIPPDPRSRWSYDTTHIGLAPGNGWLDSATQMISAIGGVSLPPEKGGHPPAADEQA